MDFCFTAYKEKDMKLNTKTQLMNIISDENLEKLVGYETFCLDKSAGLDDGSIDPDNGEALYHLGAKHAFSDALDMVENVDVTKKTAVNGKLLVAVVVIGAGVAFYGPIKRFAVDVKTNFKANVKARQDAQKRIDGIINDSVVTPKKDAR
jgi:hypothetical protein